MGEARRRGTKEERQIKATIEAKAKLYEKSGLINPEMPENIALKCFYDVFLNNMKEGEWKSRKKAIIARISQGENTKRLAETSPIRDKVDEIGWYLLLTELALTDPLCLETNQAARALPFIYGIGSKWQYKTRVQGIEDKIHEALNKQKNNPDGILFEMLIALSYASLGWEVELLKTTPPGKSPDIRIKKESREYFIECKKQSRRPDYSAKEHQLFLELWDPVPKILTKNGQWVWLEIVFHDELTNINHDFLAQEIIKKLPLPKGEHVILDNGIATIKARRIDQSKVQNHLSNFKVKDASTSLRTLLGADWAPRNSGGPMVMTAKHSRVSGCEHLPSSRWVEDIEWASGCTWYCDAPKSIEKKARDVNNLLREALDQVPTGKPCIIHIAIETLEGRDVDRLRAEKIRTTMARFTSERPIEALLIHSIQCNDVIDKLFEVDETVDWYFGKSGAIPDIPRYVLLPSNTSGYKAAHWDLYSN